MDVIRPKKQPNPREKATTLSILFWCWTINLFRIGYSKDVTVDDLYDPLDEDRSNILGDKLETQWNMELKKSEKPNLPRVLFHTFRKELLFMGILHTILEFVLKLGTPVLLGLVLKCFEPEPTTTTRDEALLYALSLSFASIATILVDKRLNFQAYHLAGRVRIAVCSLIYRKALRLSKTALGEEAPGKIVNLMASDVNKFDLVMFFLNFMWSAPLMTIAIAATLYFEAGVAALAGVAVMLTFVPIQMYMGKLASVYRLETTLKTDTRIRLLDEIISGIQVIKMYAWEKPFCSLIRSARKLELRAVKKSSYVRGFLMSCSAFMTRAALYAAVMTAIALGRTPATIDKVFVVSSLYVVLAHSGVWTFVRGYAEIAECKVSMDRVQSFLTSSEFEGTSVGSDVSLDNISVKWNPSSSGNTLDNLNLKLEPGKLYVVIGSVGSGKSTLLSTILGETQVVEGSISVSGQLSYASQDAWIFGATVRQNILFGQEYDEQKYRRVVEACSLLTDLQRLRRGDQTDVSERGDSLSGGQKARINLARAVYRDADVYLLDDPLSAVDVSVGKSLFDECVDGYLKGKTRILVTHQLRYARRADGIVRLDGGRMRFYDAYDRLLEEHPEDDGEDRGENSFSVGKGDVGRGKSEKKKTNLNINEDKGKKLKHIVEKSSKGSVGGSVFLKYLRSGSSLITLLAMILLFLATQFLISFNDYFVPYIVYNAEKSRNQYNLYENSAEEEARLQTNIYIYTSTVISIFVICLLRSYVYYSSCLRSNELLHNSAFDCLVRTAMSFFDANPSGRILNRFSKDTSAMDDQLLKSMLDASQSMLLVVGGLVLACAVNPVLMLPAFVIGIVCYVVRRVYLRTSKNIKRLEGMTRSPIFTHLNATLNGISTIRAHQAQEALKREFDKHQDTNTSSWFMFVSCSISYAFALDLVAYVFIQFVTYSFFIFKEYFNEAEVGLTITQMMSIAGLVQWGMRQSAEVANHLMSVERVLEYTQMKPEDDLIRETTAKSDRKRFSVADLATMLKRWPDRGAIEFKGVSMRYAEDLVLNDVNVLIEARQKIGIVGRTGAGKSSLIAALFRLTPVEGSIEIDNMNIASIPLEYLRSRISIIPQDPALFSGTLRHNLDPFNQYSDEAIWKALEEVELKSAMEDGLETRVSHKGSNFSVGQRQLICLARALLRNNRILMMDEATANVDPRTDALIQRTIHAKFAACTVLTVAHRLNTIIDSDKIAVMDNGCLVEFDQPYKLLRIDNGRFSGLVREAGEAVYRQFLQLTPNELVTRWS